MTDMNGADMDKYLIDKLLDLPILILLGMYLIFLLSTIYDYTLN